MKIRITALIFSVAMLAVLLTGCSCEHEWAEATCLTPKTCNLCQETEGEALGHNWAEATCAAPKTCTACGEMEGETLPHIWEDANYQEPKTCSECGATEGEPLPADFEVHGLTCTLEIGPPNAKISYPYVTTTSLKKSKKTTADLTLSDYRVFDSDENHPAKEGYEWRSVYITARFYDKNAQQYAPTARTQLCDYYDIEAFSNSCIRLENGCLEYTVNYCGNEYVITTERRTRFSEWDDESCYYYGYIYVHVPVGYDGIVLTFLDRGKDIEDGMYIYDYMDENTLFFRMD